MPLLVQNFAPGPGFNRFGRPGAIHFDAPAIDPTTAIIIGIAAVAGIASIAWFAGEARRR
jgi:hypothetical protein